MDFAGDGLVFDIQGFEDKDGHFVPKEVAVGALCKQRYRALWIVAPPCDISELPPHIRKRNDRLTADYHGIHWSEGGVTMEELIADVRAVLSWADEESIIFARGRGAVKFLREVTGRRIRNLGNYKDLPLKIDTSPPTTLCSWHKQHPEHKIYNCAFHNMQLLQYHLNPWSLDRLYQNMNSEKKQHV